MPPAATDELVAEFRERHPLEAGPHGGADGSHAGDWTSTLVVMFNVGGGELLVIMLIALIVLGPQRLPDAARQVGKVMSEVRRVSSGFQRELKDALDASESETPARRTEASPSPPPWPTPTPMPRPGRRTATGTTAPPGSGDGGEDGTTAAPSPRRCRTPRPSRRHRPRPAGRPTRPGPGWRRRWPTRFDEIVTPLGDERGLLGPARGSRRPR